MLTLTQPESMIITWEVSSPALAQHRPGPEDLLHPRRRERLPFGISQRVPEAPRGRPLPAHARRGHRDIRDLPGALGRPGRIRRPVSRLARPLNLIRPAVPRPRGPAMCSLCAASVRMTPAGQPSITAGFSSRPANAAGAGPAIVAMLHLMSRPVASTAEVPGTAADGVQRIQAVDRAIVLLKAVAASTTPPTVLELARRCGINRATAWRLLRTLEHHGLVDRDVVTQRYTVGYGATVVASAVTDDALIRRVRPLLTDLACVPARRSRSPSRGGSTWCTSTRWSRPT